MENQREMKEQILKIIDTFIPEFSAKVSEYSNSRLIKGRMRDELNKLFEQNLREELIKFDAWGYGVDIASPEMIEEVDEYLKQRKP